MNTPFVFATAGHIDHGKTQLIKILTGMDTDRLKEEKERGISIELGFAHLTFHDGMTVDIIDVPGHEKFIHTMVAGVTSIDAALVVIACDEGVKPQTQEHVDILSLLGVKKGMLLLTKADLATADRKKEVFEEIKLFTEGTFLQNCPAVFTSSMTGEGIDEAKEQMSLLAKHLSPQKPAGNFFLPVDRVFTMKGFGTVVTGTLRLGKLQEGESVEILPRGLKTSARGIQVHKGSVAEALPGQRTAVNLTGVQRESIARGDVLAKPGRYFSTLCFDAEISVLPYLQKPIENRQRFHLHLGTTHALCRLLLLDKEKLHAGEKSLVQIITEKPVVTYENDRFILRAYSPMHTVAGGRILNALAARHKRKDAHALKSLESLSLGNKDSFLVEKLLKRKYAAMNVHDILRETGWTEKEWDERKNNLPVAVLPEHGVLHRKYVDELLQAAQNVLKDFHEKYPEREGISLDDFKNALPPVTSDVFSEVMRLLLEHKVIRIRDGRAALHGFQPAFSESQSKLIDEILESVWEQKFMPPSRDELTQGAQEREKILQALLEQKKIVAAGTLIFHASSLNEARDKLLRFFETKKEMDVQDAKNLIPVTRKYLIPLLEYFDSTGLTIRVGNKRILRKKAEGRKPKADN